MGGDVEGEDGGERGGRERGKVRGGEDAVCGRAKGEERVSQQLKEGR